MQSTFKSSLCIWKRHANNKNNNNSKTMLLNNLKNIQLNLILFKIYFIIYNYLL